MRLLKLIPCVILTALLIGCETPEKPDDIMPDVTETTPKTILIDEKLSVSEAKTIAASGTFKYSYINYTLELTDENYDFEGNSYYVFQATIPVEGDEGAFRKIDPPVAVNKISGATYAVHADKLVPIAEDSFWGDDQGSTVEVAKHFNWNGQFIRDDYYSVLNMISDDKQTFHFSLKLENAYGECSLKSLVGKVSNTTSTNELNIAFYDDPYSDFSIKFTFLDDETIRITTEGENPYGDFGEHDSTIDGVYTFNELVPPEL